MEENVVKPMERLSPQRTGYNEFSQRQCQRQGATCIKPEIFNCLRYISTYVLFMSRASKKGIVQLNPILRPELSFSYFFVVDLLSDYRTAPYISTPEGGSFTALFGKSLPCVGFESGTVRFTVAIGVGASIFFSPQNSFSSKSRFMRQSCMYHPISPSIPGNGHALCLGSNQGV